MLEDDWAGYALVVGCSDGGLAGVEGDVEAMADALGQRRFDVDVLVGDRATRRGILESFDALIARARPDLPAVFYYSGHGLWAKSDATLSIPCQGIRTADQAATTADDFRGITSWELSIKQAELTRKTRNVTVILDCCFASQAFRAMDLDKPDDVRSLPYPVTRGFAAHIEALRKKYGADFAAVDARSNPDAVRLVACAQDECALKCVVDGKFYGALTGALLAVLREVGRTPVSWAAIHGSIESWVTHWVAVQHPGVEGPVRRQLFSLAEDRGSEAVPIAVTEDVFKISAGQISGVTVGDVYAVMPFGTWRHDATRELARVRVEAVGGTSAEAGLLTPTGGDGESVLPLGAIAIPIEKHAAPDPVQLDVPDDARPAVVQAIAAMPALRVAADVEPSTLPTLRVAGGLVTLQDWVGALAPPVRFPDELPRAVQILANLAAARRLRALTGEHGVQAGEIQLTWGTVNGSEVRPMAEHGGSLSPGDRVCVRVARRTDRTLYVHVFEVGPRGTTVLLTDYAHTGEVLNDDKPEFMLGRDARGAVIGIELGRLESAFGEAMRIGELIVVVAVAPANLRGLETTDPVAAPSAPERPRPSTLMENASDRGLRSDAGLRSLDAEDGFLVKRLSVALPPGPVAKAAGD
jgi:hypothetical protein